MLEALGFLTPLPVGTRRPSGRALLWFPLVGALLGAVLGLAWRGIDELLRGQGLVVGSLLVAVDLALTGAIHFDGFVDSADGLFAPGADRVRRLVIMAGPETGSFGMAAGVLGLLLRVACLAQMRPAPLLLVALWCASRTTMATVAAALDYARREDGGLASAFLHGMPPASVIGPAGALLALFAGWGWDHQRGPIAVVGGLLAAVGVALLAKRRLGGFTGDVLGACGFVCETVGLVVAAAALAR